MTESRWDLLIMSSWPIPQRVEVFISRRRLVSLLMDFHLILKQKNPNHWMGLERLSFIFMPTTTSPMGTLPSWTYSTKPATNLYCRTIFPWAVAALQSSQWMWLSSYQTAPAWQRSNDSHCRIDSSETDSYPNSAVFRLRRWQCDHPEHLPHPCDALTWWLCDPTYIRKHNVICWIV